MLFSALRPGMSFAGIATADEPRRMLVSDLLSFVSFLDMKAAGRDHGSSFHAFSFNSETHFNDFRLTAKTACPQDIQGS